MAKAFKAILSASIWGILANIISSLTKFLTVPLLIAHYGKADYGLIALSLSLNAYLRILEMGLNIGAIRFFSIWFTKKETDKIVNVSQSSITFYGIIGLINVIIFVWLSFYPELFSILPAQVHTYQWILYILAASSMINWYTYVFSQLLVASGEIGWSNKLNAISSILGLGVAYLAIVFEFPLEIYFLLYTITTLVVIPATVMRLKKTKLPLIQLMIPKWHYTAFKEVLVYSSAIFAMSIFQFIANNIRPLLLAGFSNNGSEINTDYRIIQTICLFVLSFSGIFSKTLLPISTKHYASGERDKLEILTYKGTKYVSVFFSFVICLMMLNSSNILRLYVGEDYLFLTPWLNLWLLTILLYIHNSPIASIVLSTGKTSFLIYSSAIACAVSIPVTIFTVDRFGVGAAVIGYFVYILVQMSAYYFYYIPRILHFNSSKLFFGSFFIPAVCGLLLSFVLDYIAKTYTLHSAMLSLVLNSIIFTMIFFILIILFVIKPPELRELLSMMRKRKAA